MSPDKVFRIANIVALPPWILMAALPNWEYTALVVNSFAFPIGLSLLYTLYISLSFGKSKGNFRTLDGLASLFRNKNALLAGWIHYLAFDMLVGTYEWRDALSINLPQYLLIPALFFTLMFGPFGFVLYLLIRYLFLAF
ncbi:hypothetical protein LPTSP4_18920 [Leptospira ryugenii]|uniref:DUF4281 domain-containing protein n=1 Tax=Leptospira ryugenii TaxID=1917863 RepID=A0A2P2E0F5_9LEPT|nr:ABA4-like family protein [Leptospira ryugenii]GBF50367.1 hypothetical protein LPTSP4_18920 [Leptospira ryugenii]